MCKSGTEGDAAELDPKNLMYPENQRPHPSQEQPLSVTRQVSSIPQVRSGFRFRIRCLHAASGVLLLGLMPHHSACMPARRLLGS